MDKVITQVLDFPESGGVGQIYRYGSYGRFCTKSYTGLVEVMTSLNRFLFVTITDNSSNPQSTVITIPLSQIGTNHLWYNGTMETANIENNYAEKVQYYFLINFEDQGSAADAAAGRNLYELSIKDLKKITQTFNADSNEITATEIDDDSSNYPLSISEVVVF